jgi:hypothetical protein
MLKSMTSNVARETEKMNIKGPCELVDGRTHSLMAFHCLATTGGSRWQARPKSCGWR